MTTFWILLIGLAGPGAFAQDAPEPPAQPGPEARKTGPQKPPAEDQEAERRLKELEKEVLLARLKEQQRVWIERRNATIEQIVEDFRKQTGANILVDPRNIPEDFRIREFVVRGAPFREAFEHFLKLAELEILEETATILRIGRPVRMSLSVTDADVKDVLTMIAKVANANIVFAPERVKGKISLNVNDVPWSEILENVVKTLSLTTVRESHNIIRIITPEELQQQMETRVFKLRYIMPPATYQAKISPGSQVEGQPLQGPKTIEEIEKFFPFLKLVEASLTKTPTGQKIGEAFYDHERNALVVRDTKPVLDRIAEIIKVLDTEPDMVMISLKFLSTRNEDVLAWGTSWFGIDQLGAAQEGIGVLTRTTPFAQGFPPPPFPPNPQPQPTPIFNTGTTTTQQILSRLPFGIHAADSDFKPFYFLTEYDLRVLFRAFKRDQYTKLLQEPTLSVMDGTDATIFVGEEVPFAVQRVVVVPGAPTQTTLEPGPGSPVKIGFQVLVQPRILKEENQVVMTVIPQNTILTGKDTLQPGFERFTFGTQSLVLPRTGETTLVTRLKIGDGQTAVLGGLMVERASVIEKGIPVLRDVPILSGLFRDESRSKTKEHLLIFITPKIVRNRAEVSRQLAAERRLKAAEIEEDIRRLRRYRLKNRK